MRLTAVLAILISAAVGYVILLNHFGVYETPLEQQFGAAPGEAARTAGVGLPAAGGQRPLSDSGPDRRF